MKTAVKNLIVAAILLGTLTGTAHGPAKNGVVKDIIRPNMDPVFIKRGETVLMNLLNLSKDKVSLRVYDSQNRLVFHENIEGRLVVEKAFNFEKAFEDQYTIVVSDVHGTYRETVEVK